MIFLDGSNIKCFKLAIIRGSGYALNNIPPCSMLFNSGVILCEPSGNRIKSERRLTLRPRVLRQSATVDFDLLASHLFVVASSFEQARKTILLAKRRGTPELSTMRFKSWRRRNKKNCYRQISIIKKKYNLQRSFLCFLKT